MWLSRGIEIPREGCTSLPMVKFCLPALRFRMGRNEGENGSFIAIRMRIHQNFSSSMSHSWTDSRNS